MKNHRLYEVNLERQIAFCVVCGYTDIYVRPTRTRTKPQVICINKFNEQREYMRKYRRTHYVGKSNNPHALSQIDEEKETAIVFPVDL